MGERQAGDPPLHYEFHVFVCTNRRAEGHPKGSCAARGSEGLLAYMKQRAKQLGLPKIRVNGAACLDRCECGPCAVIYPEGVWYKIETEADVDTVLSVHLTERERATSLMLPA